VKHKFLYACGTGFWINDINGLSVDLTWAVRWKDKLLTPPTAPLSGTVLGLNGRSAIWDLKSPAADPFPSLLDPNVWEPQTIEYPAAFFGGTGALGTGLSMGAGINLGRDRFVAAIKALPAGQKFALGGYSQGAALISSLYLMGLQEGTTGPLEPYRDRFIGGVCFGNPRRQRDYLGKYGVWSGAWDDPGSNSGGGGAFPSTGSWKRLTGCDPDEWLEFTAPGDIFSSVGTTDLGLGWTGALDAFIDLTRSNVISTITSGLLDDALWGLLAAMGDPSLIPYGAAPEAIRNSGGIGNKMGYYVDGIGVPFEFPGGGHVTYPTLPPCDSDGTWTSSTTPITPGDGKTYLQANQESCYQLGLRFLEEKAAAIAAAPIVLPSTPDTTGTAGWSTTLAVPA